MSSFQELLDEFGARRAQIFASGDTRLLLDVMQDRIQTLEWAVQSIIEKLRDSENKPI